MLHHRLGETIVSRDKHSGMTHSTNRSMLLHKDKYGNV